MYEVEIKILEIDRLKTEGLLLAAGAKKIFDDRIHAVYYDFGDDSIREGGGTLRLRKEGGRAVLTFKRHVEDRNAKVREEQEVVVSDFLTTRFILEAIGLSTRIEMSKHRTTYELGGTHFEFDKYSDAYAYIPEFLEKVPTSRPLTCRLKRSVSAGRSAGHGMQFRSRPIIRRGPGRNDVTVRTK
jgi:predicted adenylyl cyclase CyaB